MGEEQNPFGSLFAACAVCLQGHAKGLQGHAKVCENNLSKDAAAIGAKLSGIDSGAGCKQVMS
ncbi:MAG: hypothetical protein IT507_03375 [Burkholderiaceae bacterium]|jgi:hypothetical protein|nr:hypothetical protein [Burkholderiaceae bacterium]